MSQDELDELFGEEPEDSPMELTNSPPENGETEKEEEESSIESQETQDRQEVEQTQLTSEINLSTIQKLSNQGLIVTTLYFII